MNSQYYSILPLPGIHRRAHHDRHGLLSSASFQFSPTAVNQGSRWIQTTMCLVPLPLPLVLLPPKV
jgi:hypothetical protein